MDNTGAKRQPSCLVGELGVFWPILVWLARAAGGILRLHSRQRRATLSRFSPPAAALDSAHATSIIVHSPPACTSPL